MSHKKVRVAPLGMASLFDMLPNELMEINIKMAMGNMNTQERHDFLVKVIAKVSVRLKNIAGIKSMWKGFSPFEMLPDKVAEKIINMAKNSQENGIDASRLKLHHDPLARLSTKYLLGEKKLLNVVATKYRPGSRH